MKIHNISIVIPTFDGKGLLEKYLPAVVSACKYYSIDNMEIIVVDDASTDGTALYLRSYFPFIKIITHETNKGFSISANDGVFSAANDIVVLLNNDVEPSNDFLTYFPGHFADKDVFAVRPGLKDSAEDDIIKDSRTAGGFRRGFFEVTRIAKTGSLYAFFAGGGCSALDKAKFIEMGGFDDIFSPFYFEDVDLSYRAWKRGWKIMYEPKCLAYHIKHATISRMYKDTFIDTICERNKYFLVWKNITDKMLLLQHFAVIPARIIITLFLGRFIYLKGFLMAISKLKEIIKERNAVKPFDVKTDREILGYFTE